MKIIKLERTKKVDIIPTVPFHFDSTFHKPAHFASADNYWEPGVRWQTFRFGKKSLGTILRNSGTVLKPKITLEIYNQEKLTVDYLQKFIAEIRYRYNLDLDLTGFYKRFSEDKNLGPAIKKLYGMRPGIQESLYEYLIIGILLQNCTVRRSIQMMQALFEKYGTELKYAGKKLYCFWEPGALDKVDENDLRVLKIGYRAKFIKRIDSQFKNNLVDELDLRSQSQEIQMKELLKLYGVGPATVWYLLFDVFHQYNFFNHISPWEQKIYSKIFFNQDPEKPVPVEKLLQYFEKYGEYKQLAVHYLWEDLWWTRLHLLEQSDSGQERKSEGIPWLEKLIRV